MSNTKHFGKGSEQPTFPDDGVLRLFGMRFCPFTHRVHLLLNAKNVPYHTTNINLNEKPEWYSKINATNRVPALQLLNEPDAPFLVESLVITEYLDEKYPQNPLYPRDPLAKAQAKLLIERFGPVHTHWHKAATEPADCGNAVDDLNVALDVFEKELKQRGTPYFTGESIGIVDYAFWPWFERLELLPTFHGETFVWTADRYPILFAWKQRLLADAAVQKIHLTGDVHAEFMRTRIAGNPNFDLLVKA